MRERESEREWEIGIESERGGGREVVVVAERE